jgi:hypothetical protein
MNTYSSGYTLTALVAIFGWIFIAASAILGIFVYANAPRDFEYIGFFVFLAGAFQGIILLGIGAIGEAILDGALFQKKSFETLSSIDAKLSKFERNSVERTDNGRTGSGKEFSAKSWMDIEPLTPLKD